MNAYNQEQIEAIVVVRDGLKRLSPSAVRALREKSLAYRAFRNDVDDFLLKHFSHMCIQSCYENQISACCSREGITTFFADVVLNALFSQDEDLDVLLGALNAQELRSSKCVYLGGEGCLWRIKPIVCEMFLCQPARNAVFARHPQARDDWNRLKEKEKEFTWPSRPVLFENLEHVFLQKGYESSLMYFHNSPGLIRIRNQRKHKKTGNTNEPFQ